MKFLVKIQDFLERQKEKYNQKFRKNQIKENTMAQQNIGFEGIMAEAFRAVGIAHVLIAGKTGVGKSTLINAVFEGDLATTGSGQPVTKHIEEITKEDIPVTIFDSRGLELEKYDEVMTELKDFLAKRHKNLDPQEHIHIAWLCISEDSRRVEEAEIKLVKILNEYMPVIVVITKIRSKKSDNGFSNEVKTLLPLARNIIRVRALEDELDEGQILLPTGLKELIHLTIELVPEGQKKAIVGVQKIDIQPKIDFSRKAVGVGAIGAAAAAAIPVPIADAFVIATAQINMLAVISVIFGMKPSGAFLSTLISSAIGIGGATAIGRWLAGEALKLFGNLGGVINAATAGVLTIMLGEAYIQTLAFMTKKGENLTPERVAEVFKTKYKDMPQLDVKEYLGELFNQYQEQVEKSQEIIAIETQVSHIGDGI